jgi:hypothetical protein
MGGGALWPTLGSGSSQLATALGSIQWVMAVGSVFR